MEKDTNEFFKTYASQEEWQNEIDSIIGKRLGEFRETKDELTKLKEVTQNLMSEYAAENPEDIILKAKEREEKVKKSAMEKSDRIVESGMDSSTPLSVARDPSRFSFAELDDISERVKRGEIIEF